MKSRVLLAERNERERFCNFSLDSSITWMVEFKEYCFLLSIALFVCSVHSLATQEYICSANKAHWLKIESGKQREKILYCHEWMWKITVYSTVYHFITFKSKSFFSYSEVQTCFYFFSCDISKHISEREKTSRDKNRKDSPEYVLRETCVVRLLPSTWYALRVNKMSTFFTNLEFSVVLSGLLNRQTLSGLKRFYPIYLMEWSMVKLSTCA